MALRPPQLPQSRAHARLSRRGGQDGPLAGRGSQGARGPGATRQAVGRAGRRSAPGGARFIPEPPFRAPGAPAPFGHQSGTRRDPAVLMRSEAGGRPRTPSSLLPPCSQHLPATGLSDGRGAPRNRKCVAVRPSASGRGGGAEAAGGTDGREAPRRGAGRRAGRVRRGRPTGPGRGGASARQEAPARPLRARLRFFRFFRLRLHAARLGISRPRTSPRGGRAFPAPSDVKRLWPSGAVKRPWLERANVPAASTAAPTRSFWKRLLFPATRPLPSPRRRGSFPGLQARTAASSPQAQLLHGGRPPAPVGSPAVSRTHSAVFSRAIKRQKNGPSRMEVG